MFPDDRSLPGSTDKVLPAGRSCRSRSLPTRQVTPSQMSTSPESLMFLYSLTLIDSRIMVQPPGFAGRPVLTGAATDTSSGSLSGETAGADSGAGR